MCGGLPQTVTQVEWLLKRLSPILLLGQIYLILLYSISVTTRFSVCFQQLLKCFINLLKVIEESLVQFDSEARIQVPSRGPD